MKPLPSTLAWVSRKTFSALKLSFLLAVGAFFLMPLVARADLLDQKLLEVSEEVIKELKKMPDVQNVGILHFRIKAGNKPLSYKRGPLHWTMATRLENALVLKNDRRQPLGIIHNASAVALAHKIPDFRRPEGRRQLFEQVYPLAWGTEKVKADVFLTGLIAIDPVHEKRTTVTIQALRKDSPKLQEVLVFGLTTDQSLLSDLGENFLLSPVRSRELVLDQFDAASTKDSQDREENKESPINSQESWVKLHIRYADKGQENQEIEDLIKNAQDQNVEPDPDHPGQLRVPEPGEGQVVGFVVENISKERIGVVLKVNGQNTLFEENDEPQRCTKWILDPGEQVTITGIQVTDQESIPFQVLSEADSVEAYSDLSGTFELCVFRSRGEESGKKITERKISLRGLTERQSARKPAANLMERQRQLRQAMNVPRGLVVPDKEKGTRPDPTERVSFPNPVQVMLQTIHYYKAKDK